MYRGDRRDIVGFLSFLVDEKTFTIISLEGIQTVQTLNC